MGNKATVGFLLLFMVSVFFLVYQTIETTNQAKENCEKTELVAIYDGKVANVYDCSEKGIKDASNTR